MFSKMKSIKMILLGLLLINQGENAFFKNKITPPPIKTTKENINTNTNIINSRQPSIMTNTITTTK